MEPRDDNFFTRPVRQGYLLLGLVAWVFLWYAAQALSSQLEGSKHPPLRLHSTEDGLRLTSSNDGPYVITHLTTGHANSESEKRTAALNPPMAIIDSHGGTITKAEFAKLKWVDLRGEPATAPGIADHLEALYFRPERATEPQP